MKHRRSVRLQDYDYSRPGAYFVTICTLNRECLFGEIIAEEMRLNATGRLVADEWERTAAIRHDLSLDAWVVMPNHFHGILVIADDGGCVVGRGTARRAPTVERFGCPTSGSVPTIIRAFKAAVTKRVNELCQTPGAPFWQRNYWEHVIRNASELEGIRQYILDNPIRWEMDRLHPLAGNISADVVASATGVVGARRAVPLRGCRHA